MHISKLFGLLFILALFSACNKDEDVLIDINETDNTHVVLAEGSFQGIVTNQQGEVIESATISANGMTVITDENGFYSLRGDVEQNGAYLKVTKLGYFDSYANIAPSISTKQVNFTLLERTESGSIASASGGEISGDNFSIQFEANSFKTKTTGAAYNGAVKVFAHYVDPTNTDVNAVVGDLLAVNDEDDSVILSSYGMVHVELEGTDGQPLDLSREAILNIAVPTSKQSIAAPNIPLWYFDVETGLWQEDGEATLENGTYTGSVSHFTLWNVDLDYDFYTLTGEVIYNGSPVTNVYVELEWVEENETRITYLDADGKFEGKVPQDATIIAKVADFCGDLMLGQDIGQITGDTDVILDLALEPCNSDSQYQVYFGFNGQPIHTIPEGVTVESVNPVDSIYTYHFNFVDTSQPIDIEYDWYLWESGGPGTNLYTITYATSGITVDSEIYVVTGEIPFSDVEETSDYVYVSTENIRFEVQEGNTGNFNWYNGDLVIRGKK